MERSREMMLNPMWLFICLVLHSAPSVHGQNYTNIPVNTTASMGKSATFTCTVIPTINMAINFTGLNGNCEVTSTQVTATWQMSNIGPDVNNTAFTCVGTGLPPVTGYLWITGASSYYLMLFGCVMGGFFGILIVFVLAYVSLKKSEKLQECFKGKDEDEDVIGGVQEETLKD